MEQDGAKQTEGAVMMGIMEDRIKNETFIEIPGSTDNIVVVVRCKDCKNWMRRECGAYGTCKNLDGFYDADWYCADGERKEGR